MIKHIAWTVAAMSGVLLVAPSAWADNALGGSSSQFARDRNISVRQRPRPGFEANGAHLGGFTLFPRVTVSVTRDDNIYATQNGAVADTIVQVNPEVLLQSNWARNALDLYARAFINRYIEHTTEDANSYVFGGTGRLDVGRTSNITAGASWGRFIEPRTAPTAPGAAAEPTLYDLAQANLGALAELNRMRFEATGTFADYTYFNDTTTSGGTLVEDFRDRDEWTETGRAEYAVSPATSVYLTGGADQRDYRLKPPTVAFDQTSQGYNVQAGTNFDITHLIRGEVQVGEEAVRTGSAEGAAGRDQVRAAVGEGWADVAVLKLHD